MEITNKLSRATNLYAANYAVLNIDSNELTICKEVYETSDRDEISLKNIEYSIIDGILYFEATKIRFHRVFEYFHCVSEWNYSPLYYLKDERKHIYELSNVKLDTITKKHWFKKNEEFTVINSHDYPYLKLNEEEHFTYALHPFKLKEF